MPRRRAIGVLLLLVVALSLLLGIRYLPSFFAARGALQGARQLAAEARSLQVQDLTASTLERLHAESASLRTNLLATQALLTSDPIVGALRALPPARDQLAAADRILSAATDLADAADVALGLGDGFVAVRGGPSAALLGGLVRLVATSGDQVARLETHLDAASATLAGLRPTRGGLVAEAADSMAAAIERMRPLIAAYRSAASLAPSLLGWGGERRYLVLAQDPAELRPTGGYTGTYGIVTFKGGELGSHTFSDVYSLDLKPGRPFVQPPEPLANHLLGTQSWQLADANWSPDWPSAAQDALRLYANESGDTHIDGVIALTTYALDGILSVLGPVRVADYGVDVKPGEVTMTALQNTRGVGVPSDRKAFLDALAAAVLARLQALPSSQWQAMADALQELAARRLMMVWSADPRVEALLAAGPLGGLVRQDTGDYLAVSEANVAPTSKFNLIVHRSSRVTVGIGPDGTIANSLDLSWQNSAGQTGEPYTTLRAYSTSQKGFYGAYVRMLIPSGSQLLDAKGQSGELISGVESTEQIAGRDVIGNYLLMPPGMSSLSYRWQPTLKAAHAAGVWTYRLTIQKQPGTLAEPLDLLVSLPHGATVTSAPAGATVDGDQVVLSTSFVKDIEVTVAYRLP